MQLHKEWLYYQTHSRSYKVLSSCLGIPSRKKCHMHSSCSRENFLSFVWKLLFLVFKDLEPKSNKIINAANSASKE